MRQPPTGQRTSRDLLGPTNDAAKHISAVAFTFFVACVFIGISVSSTTHERLLGGGDFELPIFGVTMGLELFFTVAPLLIVLLHLHLLVLEHLLACKIALLPEELVEDGVGAHFAPALPVNVFLGAPHARLVRILLRLLLFAANVVLPQTLLVFIQLRFLPYHSVRFTFWHQVLLLFDIVMVFYFYRLTTRVLRESGLRREGFWTRTGQILWPLGSAVLALFCLLGAVVPGTWLEAMGCAPLPFVDMLKRNISIRGPDSIADGPSDGLSEEDLRRFRGLKLAGRNLRNADFVNCQLPKADFRGADLEGARFIGADLRGAQFLPGDNRLRFLDPPGPAKRGLAATDWRDRRGFMITNLRNARFAGANLRGASFLLADLDGADFYGADLRGTELLGTGLRRATLERARLQGAELAYADLTGSQLRGANLTGASLQGAYLLGANLDGARMWAANLSGAHMQGATFANAVLDAGEFQDAEVLGANFRRTFLRGAANLELDGVVLRGSRVSGLNRCASRKPPYLTDLRELDFQPAIARPRTPKVLKESLEKQKLNLKAEVLPGPLQAEALTRLADHFNQVTCLVSRPPSLSYRQVLYQGSERKEQMAGWPPAQSLALYLQPNQVWGEPSFYLELAHYLIEQACQDAHLATAVAFKIASPHLSVDPDLRAELRMRLVDALKTGSDCAQRDLLVALVCELEKQDLFLPKGTRCPDRTAPGWVRLRFR